METTFTPFVSLFGGVLIGCAALLLMGTLGRIMGATGIVSGLIMPERKDDMPWRIALVLGMVSAPAALFITAGWTAPIQTLASPATLAIGGLLVGLGVSFGGGCTSGHGVCGIARLSPRSIVATLTFMTSTAITVFVLRHLIGA